MSLALCTHSKLQHNSRNELQQKRGEQLNGIDLLKFFLTFASFSRFTCLLCSINMYQVAWDIIMSKC